MTVQMKYTVSALFYLKLNAYWNLQVGNKMSLKKEKKIICVRNS